MKQNKYIMKPQDLIILFKILALDSEGWQQMTLAESLGMSQSEISQSFSRSKYSGLLDGSGKKVSRLALMDFIQFGLAYVFPQKPGPIVRGVPTAHSAPPLNSVIQSNERFVWPYAKGMARGQSIVPLYPSVVEVYSRDEKLYEFLALADAVRVGRSREKAAAIDELKNRILYAV